MTTGFYEWGNVEGVWHWCQDDGRCGSSYLAELEIELEAAQSAVLYGSAQFQEMVRISEDFRAELEEEADGLNVVIDEYIDMYIEVRGERDEALEQLDDLRDTARQWFFTARNFEEERDQARELARRFYNEKQDILDVLRRKGWVIG